jgi:ABC-type multidrug transport system permease subunit
MSVDSHIYIRDDIDSEGTDHSIPIDALGSVQLWYERADMQARIILVLVVILVMFIILLACSWRIYGRQIIKQREHLLRKNDKQE